MARPKRDPSADKEKVKISLEWQRFRADNKLSQKFLAEIIGISRRTIQSIEAGEIIPQNRTLDAFKELQDKYESEGKSTGKRKKKAA